MARWKVVPDSGVACEYVPFLESKKYFAVDASGSTIGAIMSQEAAFVNQLHNTHGHSDDQLSLWGTVCDSPFSLRSFDQTIWQSCRGGTDPQQIIRNSAALDTIKRSNVWYLVTDGEVDSYAVTKLATLARLHDILNVPIVFVIVGYKGIAPENTDISVGVTFFAEAQDAMIIFKDMEGIIYLIAAKGCFAPLGGTDAIDDLSSWDNIPVFAGEEDFFTHCESHDIKVLTVESRENFPRGVSLGPDWERANGGPMFVDLDALLKAGFLPDSDISKLLAEEAFNNLGVAYKTRNCIPDLRKLLLGQKVEQINPTLKDVAGAAKLITELGAEQNEAERTTLQGKLREAHAKNREYYRAAIADVSGCPEVQAAKNRNRLVDEALQSLAAVEAAGYSADILSRRSNRARRAEAVSDDSAIALEIVDLEGPAYRAACFICCDEDVVMSICLKDVYFRGDNTTDFALNFPLAAGKSGNNLNVLSSQNICFQCAYMSPHGQSIYREDIKAIIPLVGYDEGNRRYINSQLCLALTEGLSVGAPVVSQLFMAILDGHLKTKGWAGAGLTSDQLHSDEGREELQRQRALQWMLDQLLEQTWTREDLTSTGSWVKFPRALSWMLEDFRRNGISSRIVTYPVAGFQTLLYLGQKTPSFSTDDVRLMRITQAVYGVAAKYLGDLQHHSATAKEDWKQKYLESLYQEFNGTLIPKDLRGPQSLVTDVDKFFSRSSACFGAQQAEDFMYSGADAHTKTLIMRKIQLVLFWLIYQHKSPMKTLTFFENLQLGNHLAPLAVDPKLEVTDSMLEEHLLSIFVPLDDAQCIDPEAHRIHTAPVIQFKTPFGPSVLHCGAPTCNVPFLSLEPGTAFEAKHALAISQNRRQHLIQMFGIRGRFEKCNNGMPERTALGQAPSSLHANYHANIVQAWAAASPEERRAIVNEERAQEQFVTAVRARICEQGRGNILDDDMDSIIRAYLPSFFAVLAQALRLEGKDDSDISLYEHDFKLNSLEAKARYELNAADALEGGLRV